MRVLFVSSEIYPLAKTGGLADVSAALPAALVEKGVEVRLLMPGYPEALAATANRSSEATFTDIAGIGAARLVAAHMPDTGLPVWLVDCPAMFGRQGGLYQDATGADWPDNAQRFALLNHVAARIAGGALALKWRPDIVHANDWHSGLLPLLLEAGGGSRPATLFTIHNMAYQGCFHSSSLDGLGLPDDVFTPDGIEFYGSVSFLKAGIRYSDHLTTVSPSYAREILTPEGGCGLDGLLRDRRSRLSGILNGADYRLWDPTCDAYLLRHFSPADLSGKRICKAELQRELGLPVAPEVPLVIYLSRIAEQKMADVVLDALPSILARGVQLAVLGKGQANLEHRFRNLAPLWPGQLAVRIGYDEQLAHRLQAGGDILLHPSRFEPCGLTQLYALRYGTLPIVRNVGGLSDSVVDFNDESLRTEMATGFVFDEPDALAMLRALDRALALYRKPMAWRKLQRQAMQSDFGWETSASRYLALYRRLTLAGPAGEGIARCQAGFADAAE